MDTTEIEIHAMEVGDCSPDRTPRDKFSARFQRQTSPSPSNPEPASPALPDTSSAQPTISPRYSRFRRSGNGVVRCSPKSVDPKPPSPATEIISEPSPVIPVAPTDRRPPRDNIEIVTLENVRLQPTPNRDSSPSKLASQARSCGFRGRFVQAGGTPTVAAPAAPVPDAPVQDVRMSPRAEPPPPTLDPVATVEPAVKMGRFTRIANPTLPACAAPAAPQVVTGPVDLGIHKALFETVLEADIKYVDAHTHFCFALNKLESTGVTSYAGIRERYPELFPKSYEGAIQVFCHPAHLRRAGQWQAKLLDGTEGEIWVTYGLHPNWADAWDDGLRKGLEENISRDRGRVVAIGEIGLDYSRTNNVEEKKAKQRQALEEQLTMARRMNLPVVIHCRNDEGPTGNHQAEQDCFDICSRILDRGHKIHRHCYTGTVQEAEMWRFQFPNMAFGFTPSKNGKRMPAWETVKRLPLGVILLETDAPYFVPNGMSNFPMDAGGRIAIPGGLALVTAQEISILREEKLVDVLRETRDNVKYIYGV